MPAPNQGVDTTTVEPDPERRLSRQGEQVRKLAHLLDNAFRVPGTQRRFGIDALIGLVPGVGDVAGLAMSTGLVVQAVRLGARGSTVARMVLYVVLDATIGTIPVIGTVFDFVFKANSRSIRLLEKHAEDPARTREESAKAVRRTIVGVVIAVIVVVVLITALIAALIAKVV